MKPAYELVVVGAGPAGISAAITAANAGMDVALLDEQPAPGGQIYRSITRSPFADPSTILGTEYTGAEQRYRDFAASGVDYFPGSTVWSVDAAQNLSIIYQGASQQVAAGQLVLCVGSQERPMPFPGWQLPGVITAGAAQILLKANALLPEQPPVLAGSGPLLLLLAWQYLNAGIRIKALVDTTPRGRTFSALRSLPAALRSPALLGKGWHLMRAIRRARIPVYRGATDLRASGDSALASIGFQSAKREHHIETQSLFIHQGVMPQTQLAQLAGCELHYDELQRCWTVVTDIYGQSRVPKVSVAGDGRRIEGAELALVRGELCGLNVLHQSGRLESPSFGKRSKSLVHQLERQRGVRQFHDRLFAPGKQFLLPQDRTIVCRCEEISAATVRQIASRGCQGPNQAKSFSRCGMGPCQGRFCESTVCAIIADEQQRTMQEIGYLRVRPPVKPLTVGQLGRAISPQEVEAVRAGSKKGG